MPRTGRVRAFSLWSVAVLAITATASTQQPTLDDVLRRAGAYALEYERKFSLLVAEETYEQTARRTVASAPGGNGSNPGTALWGEVGRDQRRVLKSDYLRGDVRQLPPVQRCH